MLRLLDSLHWYWAKKRLASPPVSFQGSHCQVSTIHRPEDFPANARAYDRIAAVWNDYVERTTLAYHTFLPAAARHYGFPLGSVLELACGTGTLTRRLAERTELVVGLDASEPMLREARAHTKNSNVRYVQHDFRDFSLGEMFDAAVSGGDSLNYVENLAELASVFRCVRQHLRAGGIFVFDVLNDAECRAMAHIKTLAFVNGDYFAVYYFYDPVSRVSESRAVLEGSIERHRRIPIEEEDVRVAAREAGLEFVEHFAGWGQQFYLLCRPGEPGHQAC
jgi:2-polyprenyl-3-methyl-5-hydroxy-6-metoxy-1,4-benzoquinol methylase